MRTENMRAPLDVCSAPRSAGSSSGCRSPGADRGALRMHLTGITPNLLVADIEQSTAFYRDRLGFSIVTTVPETGPFVFVWGRRGQANVFLNARGVAGADLPLWASRTAGAMSMFIAIEA